MATLSFCEIMIENEIIKQNLKNAWVKKEKSS